MRRSFRHGLYVGAACPQLAKERVTGSTAVASSVSIVYTVHCTAVQVFERSMVKMDVRSRLFVRHSLQNLAQTRPQ